MALPLVAMEVLDVGGGAGDDMGVGVADALGAEGLGPALRKGGGAGRTGLGLEMGLGVKYWGLVVTAGWLSVVLRALTMKAGNEKSWLLPWDSITGLLELGVGTKNWGLGMTAGWLSVVLRALTMYAGNENSWLLLLRESTTRIELSAVFW